MTLKFYLAATLLATVPYVAFAQKDAATDQAAKPTLADAQMVVQLISNDESKLQTYCELGKLEDETARPRMRTILKQPRLLLQRPRLSRSKQVLST